jgi:hypothetical protein
MRLFLMSWETIGLNEKAVNSDLGLMEYALKGFRSKPFTASLASVPTALTHFQRAKVLQTLKNNRSQEIGLKRPITINMGY